MFAKSQAMIIGAQIKAYAVEHHGRLPQSLDDLLIKSADGHGPYFESKDQLLDPWGQQYQYDPNGAINGQKGMIGMPDVYTRDPSNGRIYANWKNPGN